jgi:hypothetical protein
VLKAEGSARRAGAKADQPEAPYEKQADHTHVWHLRPNPRGSAIGRFDTQKEAKEFVIKHHAGVGSIEIRSGAKRRTVRVPFTCSSSKVAAYR